MDHLIRSPEYIFTVRNIHSGVQHFNKVTYLLNYLLLPYLNSLTVFPGMGLRESSNITETPPGTQHERKTRMRGV